jgi:hypothetical protein
MVVLRPFYGDGWCTPFCKVIGNTKFRDGAVVPKHFTLPNSQSVHIPWRELETTVSGMKNQLHNFGSG